jgi:hypothetical protein
MYSDHTFIIIFDLFHACYIPPRLIILHGEVTKYEVLSNLISLFPFRL